MPGAEARLLTLERGNVVQRPHVHLLAHDDLDARPALEVLQLGDGCGVLGGIRRKSEVHADLGDVAQRHDLPLDLRLDVFRAVEREARRLAGALLHRRLRERVAADVTELRQERLHIVVRHHLGAHRLLVAEAVVEERKEILLAVRHLVRVAAVEDSLYRTRDVARPQAVAYYLCIDALQPVEPRIQVFALLRFWVLQERLEFVGDSLRAVEKREYVVAAFLVHGHGRREEGVHQRVGRALGDFRLEHDDGVAVHRRAAAVAVLDVEGAVHGTLVGLDVMAGHFGEEDLLYAVALLEVAFALWDQSLVVQVPDVGERLCRVGDDRRIAGEDVDRDVDGKLGRAQHVSHLLEVHAVQPARGEARVFRLRRPLARVRVRRRHLRQDGHVRRRDVVLVLGPGDIGARRAVFVRELLRRCNLVFPERFVLRIGRAQVVEGRDRRAVADFLQHESLQVEEARGRHARVAGLLVGLPLPQQRRLQKIHLRRVELLEYP